MKDGSERADVDPPRVVEVEAEGVDEDGNLVIGALVAEVERDHIVAADETIAVVTEEGDVLVDETFSSWAPTVNCRSSKRTGRPSQPMTRLMCRCPGTITAPVGTGSVLTVVARPRLPHRLVEHADVRSGTGDR